MERTNDPLLLQKIANELRVDILKMLNISSSGHSGGSLSAIDMVTALYFSRLLHHPEGRQPNDDRFVLSKGHGAPALYAALARAGYFDKKHLDTLRQVDSILSGHPFAPSTPGVDVCTGSLGQGLSMANGMALAGRLDGYTGTVFCMLGDGESQEGQVWEAAMTAAHYSLDNVVALLDHNGLQIDGEVKKVMNIDPVPEKWEAFGWKVFQIDGHHMPAITEAIDAARAIKGQPSIICATTIKGKGVSFMENQASWHGAAPNAEQLEIALAELAG